MTTRTHTTLTLVSALTCLTLTTTGCEQPKKSSAPSTTTKQTNKAVSKAIAKTKDKTTPTSTTSGAAIDTSSLKQDEAILTAMRAVVTKCKSIKYNRGKECPNQEQRAYDALLNQKRLAALETLVAVFADAKSPLPMRQLAAHGLHYNMISAFGDATKQPNAISKNTAQILKAAVLREDPKDRNKLANASVKAAVHALNLTGQHEQVTALINAVDDNKSTDHKWVKYHAIDHAMQYGRLKLFDTIKAQASSKNATIQRAAFHAPRKIFKWTKAEHDAICPWALSHLSKQDKAWNAGPTWLLLKCNDRDTYAKAIVDEAAKRARAGTFARPFTFAFRELCARRVLGPKNYLTDPHCKRARALLLQIADNAQIPANERVVALSAIAYQWRNQDSLKLMQRYEQGKDPALAKMAKNEIKMLKRWLSKKTKPN